MILASAQTKPKRGAIQENLMDHYRLIESASTENVNLIVFPEMSISGYEREMADSLCFTPQDRRLDKLKKLANEKNIIIIAGAPIKINTELFIGEFIIQPDQGVIIYTKQFLHPGEEEYFRSSFDYNPTIKLADEKISLAICADIDHHEHAENASNADCSIYIASIFFSPKGIPSAHETLSNYAKKHAMHVLMANFCGESWGQPSGGRSGFWNKNGEMVAEMSDSDSGLLIVEKNKDNWAGKIFYDK